MILIIDNYDSFTYNLEHYVSHIVGENKCVVVRNDAIDIKSIRELNPSGIIISPGPKGPKDSGISLSVIDVFFKEIPILGICLGMQVIAHYFGAKVIRGQEPVHGKVSSVCHDGDFLYEDISNPFEATRYHSLVVDRDSLPNFLKVNAWTHDGVIMGLKHEAYPLVGVQYHPESVMTVEGKVLFRNWLRSIG